MVTAPDRRDLVRWMQTKGLSERRGLRVVRMSASALRYEPRPDRNPALRQRILALAQRHRRYGVGMIYLVAVKDFLDSGLMVIAGVTLQGSRGPHRTPDALQPAA